MRRLFLTVFVFVCFIYSDNLFAQKKWSLEECISYALQNNIQIKREALLTQKYNKDKVQALFEFTPTVGFGLTHQVTVGESFSTVSGKFENNIQFGNIGVGGSMNLSQGLNNWNRLSKTKFDLLASIEGVEELKRNIAINIAAKYLDVLYAKENLELAKSKYKTSEEQLKSSQTKFDLGKISSADFLQFKAQTINEKVLLTNSENNLVITKLELAQLLELDSIKNFDINIESIVVPSDTINKIISGNIEGYYHEALTITPSIKIAEYKIKSADRSYKMAIGNTLPTLTLSYQIGGQYISSIKDIPYTDQVKDNVRKFIWFDLNIPIFDKLQNYTRISKAKIDKLDAQYALDQAEKNLLKNVQQAYVDARAEYFRYKSMLESEASFREVFELSREKFDLGMINAVDYGIASNNYIKAQGDLLHAKYSYIFKLKILDFYRGVPISL